MRYRFDFNFKNYQCNDSVFKYKKMDNEDLLLFRHYKIKDWDDKEISDEVILKYSHWVISDNNDMFLKALGGGAFEIPHMYIFIWHGEKIHIEYGGGGEDGVVFHKYDDGTYDMEIILQRVYMNHVLQYKDDILKNIAEAFAAEKIHFSFNKIRKFSIIYST